jgi:putative ABC transport system permease protein
MLRVTLKYLGARKLRLALTALAVTLGVAFMSGTLVLTDTIERTFDDLFADIYRGTDAVVRGPEVFETFGESQREPVPAALVDRVAGVDGVAFAEGNVSAYAQLVDDEGEPIGDPSMGPPTFGTNWTDNDDLNPMEIVEGEPPRADNEIVVDKGTADEGNLEVGDTVDVLSQVRTKAYEIAGIAKFGTADSPGGASVTLFTPAEMQRIAKYENEYDEIAVVAEDGVGQTEVKQRLQDELRGEELEVLTGAEITAENQDNFREGIGFFSTALLVFAAIALFVGIFIIYNTFTIIVAQRSREMALLRAVGASRRQVLSAVLGESVVIGLVASALGLVAGILLSTGLLNLLNAFGFDIPGGGTVITVATVVTAFVVGTTITVLSAVVPARKASRVPPVAAMRDVAIERQRQLGVRAGIGIAIVAVGVALLLYGLFGATSSEINFVGFGAFAIFVGVFVLGPLYARRASKILGGPLARFRGMTGVLARENAARNPRRTSATAAALMIGVTLVAFITIFAASAKESVAAAIDEQMRTDFIVTSGGFGGIGFSPTLTEDLRQVDEIDALTPVRFGGAELVGQGADKNEFVGAADPIATEVMFDFDVRQGAIRDLGSDNIAVSQRTAEDYEWKLGDEVRLRFGTGKVASLPIAAIYEQTEIADDFFMSIEGYEKHQSKRLQQDFLIFMTLDEGVSAEQGRAAIEPVLESVPTAELRDQAGYKEDIQGQFNQILGLVYVLLFLAILIALIGIANTLALSIYERTRELGLLRAVGMSRAQVRSAVRWESVIIALLGTGLGLGIGLLFGWAVVEALRSEGFNKFAAAPGQLLIVVVLAAIAGVVSAIGPARRASKLDVLRAITTE